MLPLFLSLVAVLALQTQVIPAAAPVNVQAQVTPVEFSTGIPVNVPPGTFQWFAFTSCHGTSFVPLQVTVRVVLPAMPWDVPAGSYLNMVVFSSEDNCATPICQNNITADDPGVCIFTHSTTQTDFFVYVESPKFGASAQIATVTAKTVAANAATVNTPRPQIRNFRSNPTCPVAPQQLRVSFRLEVPGVVENVPYNVSFWELFELPVCKNFEYGLSYSLYALDTRSAMSSFLCDSLPCLAGTSIAYDLSGSALNFIPWPKPITAPLYIAVSGWGEFQGRSTFGFAVTPMGPP